MQGFKTKIGGKEISCQALGVREGMELQGRVSQVLAYGLKAAIGKDISDVFKTGVDISSVEGSESEGAVQKAGAELLMSMVTASLDFRAAIDWSEFTELVIDSCEACSLTTKDYTEPLKVDDLNFLQNEQYKVFFWFLECQLGNFIAWNKAKPLVKAAMERLVQDAKKGSTKSGQT